MPELIVTRALFSDKMCLVQKMLPRYHSHLESSDVNGTTKGIHLNEVITNRCKVMLEVRK